jgi:hypothetical protein
MKTIRENPHLFPIVCRINVDHFQSLLINHPNQAFVNSICVGLREGFWLWAYTCLGTYPLTHDQSSRPLNSDKERDFIREQRDDEIAKGRFSKSFRTELLPGMYSMPIHMVPKPHSEKLRLINDQSAINFSLNSMRIWPEVGKMKLDTLTDLFNSILEFHRIPGTSLPLWCSSNLMSVKLSARCQFTPFGNSSKSTPLMVTATWITTAPLVTGDALRSGLPLWVW